MPSKAQLYTDYQIRIPHNQKNTPAIIIQTQSKTICVLFALIYTLCNLLWRIKKGLIVQEQSTFANLNLLGTFAWEM